MVKKHTYEEISESILLADPVRGRVVVTCLTVIGVGRYSSGHESSFFEIDKRFLITLLVSGMIHSSWVASSASGHANFSEITGEWIILSSPKEHSTSARDSFSDCLVVS